jgi:hypothetical protein
MKTLTFLLLCIGVLTFSCSEQDANMLTVINPDGSCYRVFSNYADSAFMVGDTSKNKEKIPIVLDSSWKVTWKYITPEIHSNWPLKKWIADTTHKNERVTCFARRNYKSVEEMATLFKLKKSHNWYDLKISYALDKKFRWFYTYYTYKEVYPKIKTLEYVPFEKYLTKEEAEFWFNGNQGLIKGMNGFEIKDCTEKLEEKFNFWYGHNIWNVEYEALMKHFDLLKDKKISKEKVALAKDSIFNKNLDKFKDSKEDIDFGKCMDEYFKTTAFSELYNRKDKPLKEFKDQLDDQSFLKYFETDMNYNLLMPGRIIQSNNAILHGDTLSWHLTAYRFIYSPYEISAQSRRTNIWAFIVSGIVIILAIGSLLYKSK